MGKLITLRKDVATALEAVSKHHARSVIVDTHVKEGWTGSYAPLDRLSLDELIQALYIGYEVEKTIEEKIKDLYDIYSSDRNGNQDLYDQGTQNGISLMCHKLNLKVEGINDDN